MIHDLVARVDDLITVLQTQAYVHVAQPFLFKLGLMGYDEETYDALYWVLVGVLQLVLTYAVLRPLEALWPVERWPDRKAVRVDVVYTWIARLGLFEMLFFIGLQPAINHVRTFMTVSGIPSFDLDNAWPGVTDRPLVAFLVYLVVLDIAGYWFHRWQHRIGVWWDLHAVHHSQRQMSLWSDDRNHFLDDVLKAMFFAALSLLIGVPPSQFLALVALGNFLQSLQHVNARVRFGALLERVLVSPAFHRRHHAIGLGHEGAEYGCNFGVMFPWWDMLFGTASWTHGIDRTGIRDQLPPPQGRGRDYGSGLLAQQWFAMRRLGRRLAAADARP